MSPPAHVSRYPEGVSAEVRLPRALAPSRFLLFDFAGHVFQASRSRSILMLGFSDYPKYVLVLSSFVCF